MVSTVGHLCVGAAAGRYALASQAGLRRFAFTTLLIGISIAPDLDYAVFPALGVPDSLTLGHRGATHSLVATLAVVVIVAVLAKLFQLRARHMAIGAFVAIGSHAILDSLSAGPGVAWLWPFSSLRLPTFPILPQTPLEHVLSGGWLIMLLAELIVFSPFLAYAIFAGPNDTVAT